MLNIHGGPHSTSGDVFHWRWNNHVFAAPGYVIALPNFHGSTGFGEAFAKSIHGDSIHWYGEFLGWLNRYIGATAK